MLAWIIVFAPRFREDEMGSILSLSLSLSLSLILFVEFADVGDKGPLKVSLLERERGRLQKMLFTERPRAFQLKHLEPWEKSAHADGPDGPRYSSMWYFCVHCVG